MSYYGDFVLGATVRIAFNSVNSSGVPTALVSGAVTIRKDGSDVTPSGGVTLNIGVDSNAGQNELVVNLATDETTFTAGHDYKAYLSAGTVNSVSVVGIYLGEWSIQNRTVTLPSPAPAGYGVSPPAGTTAVTQSAGGSARSPSDMTVRDVGGNPIHGAVVTGYAQSAWNANPATATALDQTYTSAAGGWTLNLPTGTGVCTIVIAAAGDQSGTGTVTV